VTSEVTSRTDVTADELRALAEELARAAGELALAGRRAHGIGTTVGYDTKSSATDPVTEYDRAAEQLLVQTIRARRPDDSIVGEEGANHRGTSDLVWQLDPIDGTTNFVYDLPTWSTSVGVEHVDGTRLAGAVYVPVLDELFSAARGAGATLNGRPLRVSSADALGRSLIATGFGYRPELRKRQGQRLARMLAGVRDIRRSGSAAVDLCLVASGRVDAYFEEQLNSWDVAAGVLIATEAGAAASDFDGGPPNPAAMVVCAPGIHDALLTALRAARPDEPI
jgi:myo-inositol-1(or 4)-monophosphatase